MTSKRVLVVDPSLTCTGWALFSISNKQLLAVGNIRSLAPALGLSTRLKDLQEKVKKVYAQLEIAENDFVICEAPTTMKDPSAAFKVENVRGIFEVLARELGAIVPGRINPRSVQNEVLGLKGKQLAREHVKDIAVQIAYRLFSEDLKRLGFKETESALKKNQDIVDALLLGHLALARFESLDRIGFDQVEALFAERKYSRRSYV